MIKETLKKLTEALDTIADMEFEELKTEVEELTKDNFTTEALLEIANYYNLDEFIPYLTELKEFQESPKYLGSGLTSEQAKERLDVQHKMFDVLKKGIGEEKAKELYRCL